MINLAIPYTERCWPEDERDDGDNIYYNKCYQCKEAFLGHKGRYTCKLCAEKNKEKED